MAVSTRPKGAAAVTQWRSHTPRLPLGGRRTSYGRMVRVSEDFYAIDTASVARGDGIRDLT